MLLFQADTENNEVITVEDNYDLKKLSNVLINTHDDNAIIKTIEDNEDLKRKIVLLQQQLEEKERRIRMLKSLLAENGKIYNSSTKHEDCELVNSATQVSQININGLRTFFGVIHNYITDRLLPTPIPC